MFKFKIKPFIKLLWAKFIEKWCSLISVEMFTLLLRKYSTKTEQVSIIKMIRLYEYNTLYCLEDDHENTFYIVDVTRSLEIFGYSLSIISIVLSIFILIHFRYSPDKVQLG